MTNNPFNAYKALFFFLITSIIVSCTPSETIHLSMEVVSNQPHLISGGDALIDVLTSVDNSHEFELSVNGKVSSALFQKHSQQGDVYRHRGLITGLDEGENKIQFRVGNAYSELSVVNYSINGPIFSGPHQSPYFCLDELTLNRDGEKRRFAIGNGDYIDDSKIGENCALPTQVDYVYRSNLGEGGFLPLANGNNRPVDLTYVTTIEGIEAPYIVRIETGTINRAIYQMAVLHDPAIGGISPLDKPQAWNQRLVYSFGGGCQPGYFQATSTGGVLRDDMLSKGYAVASSTLNVNNNGGCNDVISAETAMMVKEHVIETIGEPHYTIGTGGSGGAMQQLLIAGAYPGILDGIMPSLTFADAVTYFIDSQECASLLRNFVNDEDRNIGEDIKTTIGGWSQWYVCETSLGARPARVSPHDCSAEIASEDRYDSVSNPNGVRCSIYDGMKNIFGEKIYSDINSERAFAKSPHDNVGVQYGLVALNEGLIDKDMFLELNENMGGWDIDVTRQNVRTVGDNDAIRAAYETGRITSGGAGLAQVPIIDDRGYLDDVGNFHASVYSFVTRARLERDNGHADNYVIRRHSPDLRLGEQNLAFMDQWLATLKSDDSNLSQLEKIVKAKPADLQDDCFAANGERIIEKAVFDKESLFDNTEGSCNSLYPPHAGLRLVAGGPLTNDVLKCQLKPIDFSDYSVAFTDDEKSRLSTIFAQGVCDWSKVGVEQTVNRTWLSFGPSPVNRYEL